VDNNAKKANVIWIIGDQHRGQALSCMGDINVNTPNIDLLAIYGVNFTQARSGYPLCCPFRGSMLTSKYPHNCVTGHEYRMNPQQSTIAHVFNDCGYDTAYFGKWHLDGYKEDNGRAAHHIVPCGARGGFKKWLGYENNNSQWDCWIHGNINEGEVNYRLEGYETDSLTDIFIDYLKGKSDNTKEDPFFAVLSVQPPHNPYAAPAEFMQKHHPSKIHLRPNVPDVSIITDKAQTDMAGYYAQIENLDYNIGRIMQFLKESNLLYNTHVIYFSDHGDMHGSHGQFKKTYPYEESVRIPFIIGGAGMEYAPFKTDNSHALVNHVDIAPTTLGLCNIPVPEWMEGFDYSGYRMIKNNNNDEPDCVYIESILPTHHHDSVEYPWRGIITNDNWKYVCFENMHWLLFNLNDDPYERINLAYNPKYARERTFLLKKIKQHAKKHNDEFNFPVLA